VLAIAGRARAALLRSGRACSRRRRLPQAPAYRRLGKRRRGQRIPAAARRYRLNRIVSACVECYQSISSSERHDEASDTNVPYCYQHQMIKLRMARGTVGAQHGPYQRVSSLARLLYPHLARSLVRSFPADISPPPPPPLLTLPATLPRSLALSLPLYLARSLSPSPSPSSEPSPSPHTHSSPLL
jgi:hypothetical protein